MRRKQYTQRIGGKLTSITLMPTYGTLSYLYAEMVGLPRTITREEDETTLAFRKRVNRIKLPIETKLRKIGKANNDSGIWEKDKHIKKSQVRHDIILSELKR